MRYVLGTLAIAGCMAMGWFVYLNSIDIKEHRAPVHKAKPVAVQVIRMKTKTMEEHVELVGGLEPRAEVELRSRASGYITLVNFDVGDLVEKDKLIVELDNSKSRELVSRAEAMLSVANAQLLAQRALQSQAQKEVDRQLRLKESGVGTVQEQDAAKTQLDVAKAEVDLEISRVTRAQSDLDGSKLSLDETRIKSPMSGYVATRNVDVGDLAKPDVVLLEIVDLSNVKTVVHIVEKDYSKIKVGQSATVQVDAFPDETFLGEVIRIAPVLDPETRTAAVHIEIPNPNVMLKPGMHARVKIIFKKRADAHVVPFASLVDYGEKPTLFVLSGDPPKTELREVVTGVNDGEDIEILAGLTLQDRVVTLGSRMVEDGQSVRPIEEHDLKSRSENQQPARTTGSNAAD